MEKKIASSALRDDITEFIGLLEALEYQSAAADLQIGLNDIARGEVYADYLVELILLSRLRRRCYWYADGHPQLLQFLSLQGKYCPRAH